MSRGRITASEVIALLDDESDLALDLDDDPDSDDRDREEADFINTSGTAELFSSSLMRATGIGEEEPAFQDSLLLLEDDAETLTPVDIFTDTDAMETTGCSESDSSSSEDSSGDSESVQDQDRGRGRGEAGLVEAEAGLVEAEAEEGVKAEAEEGIEAGAGGAGLVVAGV